MITDAEISQLWQFAHLQFHFGETLALNAMLSPAAIMEHRAAPAALVAGSEVPRESRKEPPNLGMVESSNANDAEISKVWQFAHLRFHFSEKLALDAMLLSPTATMPSGATLVEAVAEDDICQESRKEPATPEDPLI
jgi:hypothetical protein